MRETVVRRGQSSSSIRGPSVPLGLGPTPVPCSFIMAGWQTPWADLKRRSSSEAEALGLSSIQRSCTLHSDRTSRRSVSVSLSPEFSAACKCNVTYLYINTYSENFTLFMRWRNNNKEKKETFLNLCFVSVYRRARWFGVNDMSNLFRMYGFRKSLVLSYFVANIQLYPFYSPFFRW